MTAVCLLLGEAVCRPVAGSLLFELFTPERRALANGIFSWGVYYGYGLAFVFGIYLTEADILGYGWRSVYVGCALPSVAIGILIALLMRDPKYNKDAHQALPQQSSEDSKDQATNDEPANAAQQTDFGGYFKNLLKSFLNPSMLLLLLAACVRHTGGYCWAYNTRLYFGKYYPEFDSQLGWWLFADSLVGGSFGVFFGGFFSDFLVSKGLGLHSRLWVLSGCTLVAVPFACLTLYLEVRQLFVFKMYFSCQLFVYFSAPSSYWHASHLLLLRRDLVRHFVHSYCGNCQSRCQSHQHCSVSFHYEQHWW